MGVGVLPGDDVVGQQGRQEVDLEEVFVQILPVRPGGDLVHGDLGAGRVSVQGEGFYVVIHCTASLTRKSQS